MVQKKVALRATVRFTYRSVFGRLGMILELGWAPLLALLAALIMPSLVAPARFNDDMLDIGPIQIGQALIMFLALSAFAVRWHQWILIGDPRRLPPAAFLRVWTRFLLYLVAIYLAVAVVLALALLLLSSFGEGAFAVAEVAGIVIALLIALAILQCSLVFPAAACGLPLGPAAAWRMMRGNGWRLGVASILAAFPVMFVTGIATGLVLVIALPKDVEEVAAAPPSLVILGGLVEAAADILLVALGASLLSAFYRELADPAPAAAPQ